MRKNAVLFILILFASPCFAKPKSVIVPKPCGEMYKTALVKAGHDGYAVIEQNESAMTFKLRPPHGGVIFHAYTVSFYSESDGQACRIETDGGSTNSNRFRNQLAEMAQISAAAKR